VEASTHVADSDESAPAAPQHRKTTPLNGPEIVPPRIVSQSQPSIPLWAKDLDVDGVVELDASIDEKGNVTETKVLSGPRVLQHAAQDAVALWIFAPGLSEGKPTATHLVLTVQFQR
jgi:TonB family protein